jgi:hypothetical protein
VKVCYQFERIGYFALDKDSQLPGATKRSEGGSTLNHQLIFNRTITLKDAWAKDAQKG